MLPPPLGREDWCPSRFGGAIHTIRRQSSSSLARSLFPFPRRALNAIVLGLGFARVASHGRRFDERGGGHAAANGGVACALCHEVSRAGGEVPLPTGSVFVYTENMVKQEKSVHKKHGRG